MECRFFLVEDEQVYNALIVRARELGAGPRVWHAFKESDVTQIVNNINGPSVTFINLVGDLIVTRYPFEQRDPFDVELAGSCIIVMYRRSQFKCI